MPEICHEIQRSNVNRPELFSELKRIRYFLLIGLSRDGFIFCDHSLQGLEKIIQRDFFPDVTKLQAQKDYLEAEENGDLEKMREIAIKYGSASNRSTPRVNMPCKYQGGIPRRRFSGKPG